ncbi:MAG: choice-of-anchor D domain-containing protein [Blastocatellia bacterium]|nr:choice-of-anchor D domain-containing protein [Blastocatellia bacterium]
MDYILNSSNTLKTIIRTFAYHLQRNMRRYFVCAALVSIIIAGLTVAPRRQIAQQDICTVDPTCFNRVKQDVVFLIDRSRSMGFRGQTYNAQVEGLLRALRNPTVIPRNGSVAVAVVVFEDLNSLHVPLTEINSNATAEMVAAAVERLKCPNDDGETDFCPTGDTSYGTAIQRASGELLQNGRPDARQVLILSTDGETSDQDIARAVLFARLASEAAAEIGKAFELDVMLMGLAPSSTEFFVNKARVDQFVSPAPATDLPGMTFVIAAGDCNVPTPPDGTGGLEGPGSASAALLDEPDCVRQIDEYAENTRLILRGNIPAIALVVNTADDTEPGAEFDGEILSLRQAIEIANCNGGLATITFAPELNGSTISPLVPLPALTSPEIRIDGCDGDDCLPSITIDGSLTDTTAGEMHDDGILIRSNLDTVRGLRIINFPGAGVAIEPVCPFDSALRNRVELNALEDNAMAGVAVRDPASEGGDSINIGNTISRNEISGSATLIDLGGDGPTPNDADDTDQGPNMLINFPDVLNVVATEDGFNLTGQINSPAGAGALVEIFAATSTQNVDGNLVITGVTFLDIAVSDNTGAFAIEDIAASPTGVYTATVTDLEGNTSELMFAFNGTRPATPAATVTQMVDLGEVDVNTTSDPQMVIITNTGTAPLVVSACALTVCEEGDPDNTARFNFTGCPDPQAFINPGQQVMVSVTFMPNACGQVEACLAFQTNDPLLPQALSVLTGTGTGLPVARLTLEGGGTVLELQRYTPRAKPRPLRKRQARTFTVENIGCATLDLRFQAILRTGSDVDNGNISDADDRAFFFITAVNANGSETPINVGSQDIISIPAGQSRSFRVKFNPTIPPVVGQSTGLSANQVLPDVVTSQIIIDRVGIGPLPVRLTANVRGLLRLINPDDTSQAPVVRFTRSGDEFSVEFSAFDSNLNVNRATYQFFDNAGRQTGAPFNVDLTQAIAGQGLVRGQSFTVTQRFQGAATNPEIAGVIVTVSDNQSSASASSR